MADTLAGMDVERAWVVHGAAGWDEATPIGPFAAFDVRPRQVRRLEVDPRDFGMAPCAPADLAGADAAANLTALLDVFEQRDRGPHLQALTLQSGIALYIAGRAGSIGDGIDRARRVIDSGQARDWLKRLQRFAATP